MNEFINFEWQFENHWTQTSKNTGNSVYKHRILGKTGQNRKVRMFQEPGNERKIQVHNEPVLGEGGRRWLRVGKQ